MYLLLADVEKAINKYKPGPLRRLFDYHPPLIKALQDCITYQHQMFEDDVSFKKARWQWIDANEIEIFLEQYATKEGSSPYKVAESLRALIALPSRGPVTEYDFYRKHILDYITDGFRGIEKEQVFAGICLEIGASFSTQGVMQRFDSLACFYVGIEHELVRYESIQEEAVLRTTKLVTLFNERADRQQLIKQVILAELRKLFQQQQKHWSLGGYYFSLAHALVLDKSAEEYQFDALTLSGNTFFHLAPPDLLSRVLVKCHTQELHVEYGVVAQFWDSLDHILEGSEVSKIRLSFCNVVGGPLGEGYAWQPFYNVWPRTKIKQLSIVALPPGWSVENAQSFFNSLAQSPVETLIFERGRDLAAVFRSNEIMALANALPQSKLTTIKITLDLASPLFLTKLAEWRLFFQALPASQVKTLDVEIRGFFSKAQNREENCAALPDLLAEIQVDRLSLVFNICRGFKDPDSLKDLSDEKWAAFESLLPRLKVGALQLNQDLELNEVRWEAFRAIVKDSKITSMQVRLKDPERRAQLEQLVEKNIRRAITVSQPLDSGSLQQMIACMLWRRQGAIMAHNPEAGTRTFTAGNVSLTFAQTNHSILRRTEEEYKACVRYGASA